MADFQWESVLTDINLQENVIPGIVVYNNQLHIFTTEHHYIFDKTQGLINADDVFPTKGAEKIVTDSGSYITNYFVFKGNLYVWVKESEYTTKCYKLNSTKTDWIEFSSLYFNEDWSNYYPAKVIEANDQLFDLTFGNNTVYFRDDTEAPWDWSGGEYFNSRSIDTYQDFDEEDMSTTYFAKPLFSINDNIYFSMITTRYGGDWYCSKIGQYNIKENTVSSNWTYNSIAISDGISYNDKYYLFNYNDNKQILSHYMFLNESQMTSRNEPTSSLEEESCSGKSLGFFNYDNSIYFITQSNNTLNFYSYHEPADYQIMSFSDVKNYNKYLKDYINKKTLTKKIDCTNITEDSSTKIHFNIQTNKLNQIYENYVSQDFKDGYIEFSLSYEHPYAPEGSYTSFKVPGVLFSDGCYDMSPSKSTYTLYQNGMKILVETEISNDGYKARDAKITISDLPNNFKLSYGSWNIEAIYRNN